MDRAASVLPQDPIASELDERSHWPAIPKGITRHEYGRARGWLARHYRTLDGREKCTRRLFSDGVYAPLSGDGHDGELAALVAAIEWLLEQQASEPRLERERKRYPGYGYVRRTRRRYRTGSGEVRFYDAYVATIWDDEGRLSSTSWSIPAHGDAEAKARCDAWLERERVELGLSSRSPSEQASPLAQAG